MDNRKNTILLTVIAVATLLVAVVGATFAYFTARGGDQATTSVSVQTYATSTGSMTGGNTLTISASQENFYQNGTSITSSSNGTVRFTGAAGVDSSDFCYTVALQISANEFRDFIVDFDTALTQTEKDVLLLRISNDVTGVDVILDDSNATLSSTSDSALHATASGYSTVSANSTDSFSGFSLMPLAAGTYYIEMTGADIMDTAGTTNVYKITVNGASSVTHNWTFNLYLVNLTSDQNIIAGYTFSGRILFTQVDCSTGAELVSAGG